MLPLCYAALKHLSTVIIDLDTRAAARSPEGTLVSSITGGHGLMASNAYFYARISRSVCQYKVILHNWFQAYHFGFHYCDQGQFRAY